MEHGAGPLFLLPCRLDWTTQAVGQHLSRFDMQPAVSLPLCYICALAPAVTYSTRSQKPGFRRSGCNWTGLGQINSSFGLEK